MKSDSEKTDSNMGPTHTNLGGFHIPIESSLDTYFPSHSPLPHISLNPNNTRKIGGIPFFLSLLFSRFQTHPKCGTLNPYKQSAYLSIYQVKLEKKNSISSETWICSSNGRGSSCSLFRISQLRSKLLQLSSHRDQLLLHDLTVLEILRVTLLLILNGRSVKKPKSNQ